MKLVRHSVSLDAGGSRVTAAPLRPSQAPIDFECGQRATWVQNRSPPTHASPQLSRLYHNLCTAEPRDGDQRLESRVRTKYLQSSASTWCGSRGRTGSDTRAHPRDMRLSIYVSDASRLHGSAGEVRYPVPRVCHRRGRGGPCRATSYFGKNPGAPHYLTPVFSRDALLGYRAPRARVQTARALGTPPRATATRSAATWDATCPSRVPTGRRSR